MTTPPVHTRGVHVQVRALRKNFGSECVLKKISLEVQPGECYVIMGPSGSGKTVLLKHIIGLEKPDEGEVLIEGQSIQASQTRDKYRLAMVFQSGALLNSLTVGENVGLYQTEHRLKPPAEIARLVAEKLELVGLKGMEDRYPSELSGGMTKRVAIARALIVEPQLILYDEPTSELDPVVAVTVVQEIIDLKQRLSATTIIVTHDRDLAFGVADRIALIYDGAILAVGTPDEIRNHPDPLIQKFLTIDFDYSIERKAL
jgi:phospholipid/cholesterol/gamma-HCH transport system ATP-binding protein